MTDRSSKAKAKAVPSSRIGRFGRLSAMTAGVAGNMAVNGIAQLGQGQRPRMRNLLLTPANMSRIADQLAQMRGAAMKVGQLVSMDSGEVLPPELAQIMARLRDDAHFMPPAQLKQVLNAQWPDKWLGQFAKFDVRPIAAASIGQVHRARLKDGRDLAIKVQYPGVAKSIDSDVANVGALIRMSGLLPKGFELGPYLEEGRKQLHEETDYAREAAYLERFYTLLADDPRFAVPAFHADWSGNSILAMSFIGGTPIEAMEDAPADVRNLIATNLIDLTLKELFEFALMQTDPNFANYLFDQKTGRIILLDFGAARDIDQKIISHYRALMVAGMAGNEAGILSAITKIGFTDSETAPRHQEHIIRMIKLVFAMVGENESVDFSDPAFSRQMQSEGRALADDGFIPPPLPIDPLLLQRKFGGMFLMAARLRARVNVRQLLDQYLGG